MVKTTSQTTKRLSEGDHRIAAQWAADCAERVLHYFENGYTGDARPRDAIGAARAWAGGDIKIGEARKVAFAAHAAAREVKEDDVGARAAGHTAATAHVADHARAAAVYAIKAVVAAKGDADGEREWQRGRLEEYQAVE